MRRRTGCLIVLELKVKQTFSHSLDLQYPHATFHCRKALNGWNGWRKSNLKTPLYKQSKSNIKKRKEKLADFENKDMQNALHKGLCFCWQSGTAKACNRLHKVLHIQAHHSEKALQEYMIFLSLPDPRFYPYSSFCSHVMIPFIWS